MPKRQFRIDETGGRLSWEHGLPFEVIEILPDGREKLIAAFEWADEAGVFVDAMVGVR